MNFDNPKQIKIECSRGQLEKMVISGLRDCIFDHGDITKDNIGSAAKRVIGQLKKYMVEVGEQQ